MRCSLVEIHNKNLSLLQLPLHKIFKCDLSASFAVTKSDDFFFSQFLTKTGRVQLFKNDFSVKWHQSN